MADAEQASHTSFGWIWVSTLAFAVELLPGELSRRTRGEQAIKRPTDSKVSLTGGFASSLRAFLDAVADEKGTLGASAEGEPGLALI